MIAITSIIAITIPAIIPITTPAPAPNIANIADNSAHAVVNPPINKTNAPPTARIAPITPTIKTKLPISFFIGSGKELNISNKGN